VRSTTHVADPLLVLRIRAFDLAPHPGDVVVRAAIISK